MRHNALNVDSYISQKITNSSAITERPCNRVGQFWPKLEDNILWTL